VTAPAQITRKAIAMPLAVVLLALAPTGAWGVADVIKSTNDNEFDRATYHSDEGDLVQFQHTGGGPHNVFSTQYSDGERLFTSATISSGTTPVNGTQYLGPGTYPFICTIHFNMAAELVVRESGAPPPAPLTLDLEARKQELREKLKFFATASVASTLTAEGKAIKETTKQLAANQEAVVKAKLKRKALNRFEEKGKGKVKITGTVSDPSGTATDTVKVKLKD
jgi:plastocyanin